LNTLKIASQERVVSETTQLDLDRATIKKARSLFSTKAFRELRETCASIIKAKRGNVEEVEALVLMYKMCTENAKYETALDFAERLLQLEPLSYTSHYFAGIARMHLGDFEEAWLSLRAAVMFIDKKGGKITAFERNGVTELDVLAAEADCLFELNRHSEANDKMSAYMSALSGADSHIPTLILYAKISRTYSKWPDCIRSLLKAIVVDQNHPIVRKNLIAALESPTGVQEVRFQVPPKPESAAAYAFLGIIARDLSSFDLAKEFMSIALTCTPHRANIALTLTHVYESCVDLIGAMECLKAFLIRNVNLYVNLDFGIRSASDAERCRARRGFSCGELLQALRAALGSANASSSMPACCRDIIIWTLSTAAEGSASRDPNDGVAGVVRMCKGAVVESGEVEKHTDVVYNTGLEDKPVDSPFVTDVETSLDILGIAFTAVKIMFLLGQVDYLPNLIRVIEPSRLRFQSALGKSLHETNIRNEQAYYLCIVQICAAQMAGWSLGTANWPARMDENSGLYFFR
jgi:tetratricopeptide (TPR) repeat protein